MVKWGNLHVGGGENLGFELGRHINRGGEEEEDEVERGSVMS